MCVCMYVFIYLFIYQEDDINGQHIVAFAEESDPGKLNA